MNNLKKEILRTTCLSTSIYIDNLGARMNNKKILVISIFAAVLMALLPISSVVGVNVVKSNAEKGSVASPLFAFRQHAANEKDRKKINTNYIGKGRVFDVFPIIKSSLNKLMDRAVKLINVRPEFLTKILDELEKNPKIVEVFKENDMDMNDFKNHINIIKNNPEMLKKEIEEAAQKAGASLELPINEPEPLGFSGQPGCVITLFILLPILISIAIMIATITIITCLNIGGCFEKILEGMFQGLTPPGV